MQKPKPFSDRCLWCRIIKKDLEKIVGLQTDAPLKAGDFPKWWYQNGGRWLKLYGYELDADTKEIYTKYRVTLTMKGFSLRTMLRLELPEILVL